MSNEAALLLQLTLEEALIVSAGLASLVEDICTQVEIGISEEDVSKLAEKMMEVCCAQEVFDG